MTKLLFFDIDGTLFEEKYHSLPPTVKPSLIKARENDCRIFINTGRTLCNIDSHLKELPIDGWSFGCGTRVIIEDETIRALEYSLEDSIKLLEIYRSLKIPTVYECDTALYFDPKTSDHPMIPAFRIYAEGMKIARDIKIGDEEFRAVKMFCFIYSEKDLNNLLSTLKEAGFPFYAIDRGNNGFEMVPEGCSKALGIDIIRERYGASLEDCYVFGDSRNDLSMLTHVPNSICMGHATDDVKSVCRYVTDLPENDGIKKALITLDLID
ncbi:MAG: HAD family phosphatase [Clostridiales bacterium]|nr:HAD family phosphatase [Clostridiales bacterium]